VLFKKNPGQPFIDTWWAQGLFDLFQLRPLTSLDRQEGRRVFWEGPKFFELRPIILIDVQYIFPGGVTNFLGGICPPAPPLVTGLFQLLNIRVCMCVCQSKVMVFSAQLRFLTKTCSPITQHLIPGVGNLFAILGRTNCGLSLTGHKYQLISSQNSTLILQWGMEAFYDILP